MIGERNREVRGFLENELGPEGRKRSVVVCATSERPAPLARARLLRGAGGRRIFPRPGRQRAAGDGFGDAPGDGAARDRPGRRRAAQPEGLHALGVQPAAQGSGARRQFPAAAPSPASSPCWWKATISTSRSATPCAAFWTATSSSRGTGRAGPLPGDRHPAFGEPACLGDRDAAAEGGARAESARRSRPIATPKT